MIKLYVFILATAGIMSTPVLSQTSSTKSQVQIDASVQQAITSQATRILGVE